MERVLLSLGSNLGDRENFLATALEKISVHKEIDIIQKSPIINTDPMDVLEQPDFLNQVVEIKTSLHPVQLLDYLQSIEIELGRIRRVPKGPREIDIDILTFGDQQIQTERLSVPHHSMESRPFVRDLISKLEPF
ncbi:MAG: 2-amino-4-hydroxy-6-hydroxymethyldihydropteridine diphosphokinase [Leptospira sp.]|nr:2-amino-4-hydroxy-6-hydroxymethyldihydropteridine diphosphokinase [Leptospira sp.]